MVLNEMLQQHVKVTTQVCSGSLEKEKVRAGFSFSCGMRIFEQEVPAA